MPHYALGTARLSSTEPPTPEVPTGMPLEARYLMQPREQVLPTSQAGWTTAYGSAGVPVPTAVYPCTELSGDLLDHLHAGISGRALAPSQSPLYGRRAVGLRATDRNGQVTVHPERGVELTGDSQMFAAQDSQWADPDGDGLGLLVIYRVIWMTGGTARAVVGKRDATGKGYVFNVNGTGKASFWVQDQFGTHVELVSPDRVDGGEWHCSLAAIEPDAGGVTVHHFTDLGHPASQPLSGSPPSTLDTTVSFRIGLDGVWNAARCQVAYLALWKFTPGDTNYDCLLDGSAFDALWTAFAPQKNVVDPPGDELDLTHDATTGWLAGSDPFNGGNVVAKYGKDQFPYAVIGDAAVGVGGYGANGAMDNALSHSEQFLSPWATTGTVNVTSNAVDAPDGLQGAARVTFTNKGTLAYNAVGTGDWLGAVWVKVESYNDANAKLSIGGADKYPDGFKDYPVKDIEADKWQRIMNTYPHEGSYTSLTLLVQCSGTVVLHLWGAVLRDTLRADPYVPAWDSAGVSVSGSVLKEDWTSSPVPYAVGDSGRIRLKARFPYEEDEAQGTVLLMVHGTAGGQDVDIQVQRDAYGGENGRIILDIQKGGGTWAKVVSDQGTGLGDGETIEDAAEVEVEIGWSFDRVSAWLDVDGDMGTVVVQPTGAFSGFEAEGLCIGCDDTDLLQPDAPVYDVKIWNG